MKLQHWALAAAVALLVIAGCESPQQPVAPDGNTQVRPATSGDPSTLVGK